MKTVLFIICMGLFVWLLILVHGFIMKIAVAVGYSESSANKMFWVSIALTILFEVVKNTNDD